MIKFRVYPSQLIHMGKLDPKRGPGNTYFFLSICGRELIGHEMDREPLDFEPVCTRCQAVFAKDQATYRMLVEKYS